MGKVLESLPSILGSRRPPADRTRLDKKARLAGCGLQAVICRPWIYIVVSLIIRVKSLTRLGSLWLRERWGHQGDATDVQVMSVYIAGAN